MIVENLETRQMLTAGLTGMNLSDLEYVDLMKTARDWTTIPYVTSSVTVDSKGWPTSDGEVIVFDDRVNQWFNGPDPNVVAPDISGTYHLSFQGQATVSSPDYLRNFTVQNQVYNASTNTTTADLVVPQNSILLFGLDFTKTVNKASATGAGVTNVQLIRPGYAAGSTQLFTNDFLNALKPFGTLRYLEVDGANNYGVTLGSDGKLAPLDWSQRTLPDARSQTTSLNAAAGEAWEYMIALANTTNTDMWINIPGPATNDYVTQLANLIKNGDTVNGVHYAGLNPNLKVYVEYSNEVWGGVDTPYLYNMEAAKEEVAAGNTPISQGTTDPAEYANRRYLERAEQISTLFRNASGADPTFSRVRPVVAWQSVNPGYFSSEFAWLEANFGTPSSFFYGMGGANYAGPSDYSSVDAVLSSLSAAESTIYAQTVKLTTIANYYGLKNVAYEGGPAIENSDSTAGELNALAASRDPRVEAITAKIYADWYAAGGDLANFFSGPYGIWSPQHEWQAAELSQASNPSLSPKYRGIVDVANAPAPAVTAGLPVSASFATAVPLTSDNFGQTFTWPATGQSNLWLLNVATAGTYNLSMFTSASGSTATASIQVLLGDQASLGTFSVIQGGLTNLGSFTLHAGLNTLAIKTIHGVYDPTYGDYATQFLPTMLTLKPVNPVAPPKPTPGDAGFETVAIAPGGYAYDPTGSAWAFAGQAGITSNGSAFTSANASAPQGTQVAFVQNAGSFSQAIANWSAGSYTIGFSAAQRANYGGGDDFQVLVDGVLVSTFKPVGGAYQAYSTAAFTVAAGSHTVTFKGLGSAGGDSTSLIDAVTVATATPATPPVGDGGFESILVGSGGYGFAYEPAGSAWSFSGQAGISGNGSSYTGGNPAAPEGSQVAFIPGVGSISQTITNWSAGAYTINFSAAQRADYGGGNEFRVLVDGVVIAAFLPTTSSYQAYATASFAVAAGSHTITFKGLGSGRGDNTSLIDAVSIAVATSAPSTPVIPNSPLMGDAGFETVAVAPGGYAYDPTGSAWAFAGQAGITSNGSAFTSGNPVAPEGTQVAFVQNAGSFSQTIVNWSAGSYTIGFSAAQRANYGGGDDFQVLVDGVLVSTFKPVGGAYQAYATASFAVAAGSHTVTFKGLGSAGGDNTSLIDAVSIAVVNSNPSTPTVGDMGFETVAVGTGGYAYDPAGSAWAFSGQAGITGNGSGFTSGNPVAPEGLQVAFVQNAGSFSQTIANWSAGSYTIGFSAAQRANFGGSENLQVLVDGILISTFKPVGGAYQSYATASFAVAAGSHIVTFKGLGSTGDNTSLIDAVSISVSTSNPVAPALPTVGDAGFETVAVGPGGYAYDPTGSSWTFAGQAGITANGSGFTSANASAPQGTQVAFVQNAGSFSQTIVNWAAGSYSIGFSAAQRANYGGGDDFQVLVDGVAVATFKPVGGAYRAFATPAFTVAAGSHTITFKGLGSAGGDNTSFIDAITVATSNPGTPTVGDAGFETVAVAAGGFAYDPTGSSWSFSGQAGLSSNGSLFTYSNPAAPEGSQVAFVQNAGSFSQTVADWAAGTYTLSLDVAQRANNGTSREDMAILIDGVVIASGTPPTTGYQAFTTASFTVGAGPHTITFQGLNTVGGDNTVFIDAISLTRVS